MGARRWLDSWPAYRQVTGTDPFGRGAAARSAVTELFCEVSPELARLRGLELAALEKMKPALRLAAQTHEQGRSGTLLRSARYLGLAGAVGGAVLGRRSRAAAAVIGALLLAGSACSRFGRFEAGRASVLDPKYVVDQQKPAKPA